MWEPDSTTFFSGVPEPCVEEQCVEGGREVEVGLRFLMGESAKKVPCLCFNTENCHILLRQHLRICSVHIQIIFGCLSITINEVKCTVIHRLMCHRIREMHYSC